MPGIDETNQKEEDWERILVTKCDSQRMRQQEVNGIYTIVIVV